ncbi:MAG: hypothetical protein FGM55_11295 [Rhodoferax sp.]|nr:hypothetical protein [Rhodoferax sp.]
MFAQRLMRIVWPAFLMACVLELLVFALVDPQDLHWFGHTLELSRQAVYTLAFFGFWWITALSSALTTLLSLAPEELNRDVLPEAGPVGTPASDRAVAGPPS